jgi:dTDP-4-dehydrorhamnose reductase
MAIATENYNHMIFRTIWVIGNDGKNFANAILRLAVERHSLSVIHDQQGVPTSPSLITKVTIDALKGNRSTNRLASWPFITSRHADHLQGPKFRKRSFLLPKKRDAAQHARKQYPRNCDAKVSNASTAPTELATRYTKAIRETLISFTQLER